MCHLGVEPDRRAERGEAALTSLEEAALDPTAMVHVGVLGARGGAGNQKTNVDASLALNANFCFVFRETKWQSELLSGLCVRVFRHLCVRVAVVWQRGLKKLKLLSFGPSVFGRNALQPPHTHTRARRPSPTPSPLPTGSQVSPRA